jgi:hypothetical protein
MVAIMRSMRPRKEKQTTSMMVWVRLSMVDDEELEADTAVVELSEEDVGLELNEEDVGVDVGVEVDVELIGMT